MKRQYSILTLIIGLCALYLSALPRAKRSKQTRDTITIMSYNVENLFDTIDDVRTADEEFTPEGIKRWNTPRYYQKLRQIANVISMVGGKTWPSLVGLVEIENVAVLEDLLKHTALGRNGYTYLITDSSDPRGIDVALLYRSEDMRLITSREHPVSFTRDSTRRSRNILEAQFELPNKEKLYTYVVHWPSRREGVEASEPFRCDVARVIRRALDSIQQKKFSDVHFLIMGDFNGESYEKATAQVLGAREVKPSDDYRPADTIELYSLLSQQFEPQYKEHHTPGSYAFRGQWTQLDQFVVSGSILPKEARVRYLEGSAYNYTSTPLLSNYMVKGRPAPKRTYLGDKYQGGYSDHFPIVMKLVLRK